MRLADIDAWSAESRAAEVLMGLGFSDADLYRSDAGVFRRLAHARRDRRCVCSQSLTCCFSMSRPTISIWKARPGLKAI
jgi:hypothetical protein